jgi:hypothetical protein
MSLRMVSAGTRINLKELHKCFESKEKVKIYPDQMIVSIIYNGGSKYSINRTIIGEGLNENA